VSLATVVAAAMFVGVIAYALLGGADFGSGFYDLTAGGGERGAELRTLIDRSIGPVWEANHVWLIYVLVMWWTGFPAAFAAVTTTLFIPFMLALAGIVLRGASFAFRKFAARSSRDRL
jgi:cytochrome bd ubiquinol oxidase subunit II